MIDAQKKALYEALDKREAREALAAFFEERRAYHYSSFIQSPKPTIEQESMALIRAKVQLAELNAIELQITEMIDKYKEDQAYRPS